MLGAGRSFAHLRLGLSLRSLRFREVSTARLLSLVRSQRGRSAAASSCSPPSFLDAAQERRLRRLSMQAVPLSRRVGRRVQTV